MLKIYPDASFGLIGSRTIDMRAKKVEGYSKNQRFKVYSNVIPNLIGSNTFFHKSYERASSYIIFNNKLYNDLFEEKILNMICKTYPDLLNVRL
ncbi:hypothetical protein [Tenacibaculum aiptasiae]|uniref:hypothetical protein n=1 Tax=Tenacibaculum aiptasiae TaxID=426481 RepID=UPI00232C7DD0|nr:hypothetical protein [Tenacibaculum aiptasiae]